ncbi:hypothetical protein [Roseiterribacter gracilis]|uniref:Uncharacterized protein n=1 Tax=Roseiterribacter gracilis TaxID=2812848 RepID=A0A8S8XGD7_9PROT|nr:hypothetical protein TMPK1_24170 [Rhodospirillales bacterium TMPK1]
MRERRIRSLADAIELLTETHAARETAVLWAASDEEGGLWLTAVLDAARSAVPGADGRVALSCGDRAGDAMAALRAGIRRIAFTGSDEVAAKLTALGAELAELPPDFSVPIATIRRGG